MIGKPELKFAYMSSAAKLLESLSLDDADKKKHMEQAAVDFEKWYAEVVVLFAALGATPM